MQPLAFLREGQHWATAGLQVRPVVDPLAELAAGGLQFGEAAAHGQQVRLGGHQAGLGDPHRRLRAALRRGSADMQVRIVVP